MSTTYPGLPRRFGIFDTGPGADRWPSIGRLARASQRRINGKIDGGRQRCSPCGHPRAEHSNSSACTVPKCSCTEYAPRQER